MAGKYTNRQTTGKKVFQFEINSLKQVTMLAQKIPELMKVAKQFYHFFISKAFENIHF